MLALAVSLMSPSFLLAFLAGVLPGSPPAVVIAGPPAPDGAGSARDESAAAAQGFSVETARGERIEGQLLGGDLAGLLLSVDGEERLAAADELVLAWNLAPLETSQGAGEDRRSDLLLLAGPEGVTGGGDRLWGQLLGGDEFGLRMRLDAGLEVEVPFDVVDRLLPAVDRPLDRLSDLEGGGFDDRLWRRRDDGGLDGVTGVLARLEGRTIILESALGELSFPADDVLALVLAETEHPGETLEGWPMTVRLAGGSLFEAALVDVTDGVFLFETQFADSLAVPQEAVASLLLMGGSSGQGVPLAHFEPLEVEEWPALGGPQALLFPWRRGVSVSGQPLRVGGMLRATGLGVHANARLRYTVPEGMSSLRVTVGLSDEVLDLPAEASVTFEILVDGTSRASTGVVREGDAPQDMRVDGLQGGQLLELVTLDAGDLDAGDRAAWVDGLFFSDA